MLIVRIAAEAASVAATLAAVPKITRVVTSTTRRFFRVLDLAGLRIATFRTVVWFARMGAAANRLSGGAALDPMLSPAGAPMPAELWRRWNRPAQQFLETYAFRPAGGLHHPVRATLVTFAVSAVVYEYVFGIAAGHLEGRQTVFFLIRGVAGAASMHLRPTGWRFALGQLLTVTFNLATSVFFTEKSKKCMAATREIGRDVGRLLRGRPIEDR